MNGRASLNAQSGAVDTIRVNRHILCETAKSARSRIIVSEDSQAGHTRPKAEGFPAAPLLEAVMDVQFGAALTDDDYGRVVEAMSELYPTVSEQKQVAFTIDMQTDEVASQGQKLYRMEAEDETEVLLLRPSGLASVQLVPYRSWAALHGRFARDWLHLEALAGERPIERLAARYINRIDIPIIDGRAVIEDYLAAHIHLPPGSPDVIDYYFRFAVAVPEIGALATIQSAVMAPAVEGKVSFALDIDLVKTEDLAPSREAALVQLSAFQDIKNRLYRQSLTPHALGEFE